MDFDACSTKHKKPLIPVEESGRKFTIQNPQKALVIEVKVDGCLINDHRERCDYLFEIGQKCHCVVYLELKGADIEKAYNQLIATIGYTKEKYKDSRKICHIVASRVPKSGPKVQNLKVSMAKKYKVLLKVDTDKTSINITTNHYCET